MHSELPWNVAGIPAEAREAARAAARREGLSIGEWMTRRILNGFPDPAPDANDNWRITLPQPAAPTVASSSDSDDMLSRIARSETESQHAYAVIDQQLKAVAHRLEAAERNQSENSRAMNQAATQINSAARDQAQAFERMNANVAALTERLARIERNARGDGMRDAIKALHLGLSRVADQIGETANHSASQIATLAGNIDSLATQVVAASEKADAAAQAIEVHVTALDERMRVVERTACASAAALDHTMENLEQLRADNVAIQRDLQQQAAALSEAREGNEHLTSQLTAHEVQLAAHEAHQVRLQQSWDELQGRVSAGEEQATRLNDAFIRLHAEKDALQGDLRQHASSVSEFQGAVERLATRVSAGEEQNARVQEGFAQLEARTNTDPLDRRLSGIEHVLSDIMGRLEHSEHANPAAGIEQSLRDLASGFEVSDQRNRATIQELQEAVRKTAEKISAVEQKLDAPAPLVASRPGGAEPQAFASSAGEEAPTSDAAPGGQSDGPRLILDTPPFEGHQGGPQLILDAPPFEGHQGGPQLILDAPPFEQNDPDEGPHDAVPAAPAESKTVEATVEPEPPPFPSEDVSDQAAPAEQVPAVETQPEAEHEVLEAPISFLEAARRSAKAAAAEQETTTSTARSAMGWRLPGRPSLMPRSDKQGRRYVLAGSVFGVAVAAALTGVVLSHSMGSTSPQNATTYHQVIRGPAAASLQRHASIATQHLSGSLDANAQLLSTQQPSALSATPVSPAPQKLVALAKSGESKAQLLLGLDYLEGRGTSVDEAEAARWLSRAAQQGEPMAEYRLGTLYERGRGVPASIQQATRWYELAAKQGNRKAMHNLAIAFAEGNGEPKDPVQASMWFSRAANLGLADSQFNLAVLYERGMGVKQSLVDAYKWYLVAAAQGDAESKTRADALSSQLGAADRAAAEQAATSFKPQPLNPSANTAPTRG